MFLEIDYNKLSEKPKLWLAKPNKEIINVLKSAYNIKTVFSLGNISELTFDIPYPFEYDIRYRYLVKFKLGDYVEWFIIDTPENNGDESKDTKSITCKSLLYELNNKSLVILEETSKNATEILNILLTDTTWNIDYINTEFNNTYRSFDYSNTNKLESLFSIAETFNAVLIYNTSLKQISLYKSSEIGTDKGFKISHNKYLKSIKDSINPDSITTRLKCFGNNNLSIQRINLTGQNYIEDFSYFLYPFQRDGSTTIQSSYYMSDNLCHAVLDYFELLDTEQGNYDTLLSNLESYQSTLNTKENELTVLEQELQVILDSLNVAYEEGNTSLINSLTISRDNKISEISIKKSEISNVESDISNTEISITVLQTTLLKENNFTSNQLDELDYYIIENEFRDDNYIDDEDLYSAGLERLSEINEPKSILEVNIINPLECVEEQYDWDKIVLGDVVKVENTRFGNTYTAKIIDIEYDFENGTIDIKLGDIGNVENNKDKIIKLLYKSARTNNLVNVKKFDWSNVVTDFDTRNNRNSVKPANPTIINDGTALDKITNDDGSVNIRFLWDFTGSGDAYDIDGFIVYSHSLTDNYTYICGSSTAREQTINLKKDKRAYVLYGVPANHYYTFGVQAYRVVDSNITSDGSGILLSDIIQPSLSVENPYQPNTEVDFIGTFNGNNSEQLRRSSTTFIIGSEEYSENYQRADYIIPIGSTTAQTIINQAINDLPIDGGNIVFLEGIYRITGDITLKSNLKIQGAGYSTIISSNYSTDANFKGTTLSNLIIQDMSFSSNSTEKSAILLTSCNNINILNIKTIDYNTSSNFLDGSIKIISCEKGDISKCYNYNNSRGLVITTSTEINVTNNNNDYSSFHFSLINNSNNIVINNNTANRGGIAIIGGSYSCNVSNNTIKNSNYPGVALDDCYDINVNGNNLQNNDLTDFIAEIEIISCDDCNIQTNLTRNPVVYGVSIDSNSNNILVINNDFYETNGIQDNGTGTITTSANRT